jgi:hypothetical protein
MGFQFLNLYFWNVGLELMNGEMSNSWKQKKNVRVNVRPKKIAEPFTNGSLKEPLLNTVFNNGFVSRTIVKWRVNNVFYYKVLLKKFSIL